MSVSGLTVRVYCPVSTTPTGEGYLLKKGTGVDIHRNWYNLDSWSLRHTHQDRWTVALERCPPWTRPDRIDRLYRNIHHIFLPCICHGSHSRTRTNASTGSNATILSPHNRDIHAVLDHHICDKVLLTTSLQRHLWRVASVYEGVVDSTWLYLDDISCLPFVGFLDMR